MRPRQTRALIVAGFAGLAVGLAGCQPKTPDNATATPQQTTPPPATTGAESQPGPSAPPLPPSKSSATSSAAPAPH